MWRFHGYSNKVLANNIRKSKEVSNLLQKLRGEELARLESDTWEMINLEESEPLEQEMIEIRSEYVTGPMEQTVNQQQQETESSVSEQNNNCVSDRSKKSKKKYKSVPKRAPPPKIDSRITTSDDPFFGSIKPLPSDVVPTVREICSALLYTRLEISKSEGRALEQVSNIEVIDIELTNLQKISISSAYQ